MTIFGGGVYGGDAGTPFTGATNTTDGTSGAVTKPLAGDENKFLRGDGAWTAVGAPTGYQTVQNAGSAVAQQTTINVDGTVIAAVDNAGSNRTDFIPAATLVDIAGLTPTDGNVIVGNGANFITSTSYQTILNATVAVTKRTKLNITGTGLTAVDNAGTTSTDISLAATLQDIAGLTPTLNTIIRGDGTDFVTTVPSITNVYYVAKNGNDTTGNGSQLFPFLTIGAACTAIGNAANNAAFVAATQRYYVIDIGPGVYTEAVTIPNRPYVLFRLNGAQIVGNMTQNFDGTVFGGAITNAKVIFQGYDLIGVHTGLSQPVNGITGNVTLNRTAGAFNFNSYEFINIGVAGSIIADGAVAYTLLLYTKNTNVSGNITANQATININLYAEDCNTPGTTGLGGCSGTGTVTLRNLRNVAFAGVVRTGNATAAFNWDNVTFAAVANTFATLTANIITDSASYQSYFSNVPTKGSETITFRDSARGINSQYTPVNYTAADSTVRGNLSGIDTALARVMSWSTVAGTTQTMAASRGYVTSNAALTTFTLPATAAVGDTFRIIGRGAGGWRVAQNAGQTIDFNGITTTTGVGGFLDSRQAKNTVELVCTVANTEFEVFATNAELSLT